MLVGCGKPFSGEGMLKDAGFWSCPRYEVTFDSLNITNRARRSYAFTGVPAITMTLGLVVVGGSNNVETGDSFPTLECQSAILRVELSHAEGRVVARSSAAIRDWEVARGGKRVMLWHKNLRDVHLNRQAEYQLSVEVPGVGSTCRPLVLRPVLEGGGNELP
jgi:hypothetical protein